MLEYLKELGICGPILDLFKEYFIDSKLQVSIDSCISKGYYHACALIQGSIVSPILFNIYVSDLACLKSNFNILQYAHDTIFYIEHTYYKKL